MFRPATSPRLWNGLTFQLTFALIAVASLIYWPRDGRPVLVIPFSAQSHSQMLSVISQPGTQVMARGPFADSFVLANISSHARGDLMANGVLMLDAAAPGCGSTSSQSRGVS